MSRFDLRRRLRGLLSEPGEARLTLTLRGPAGDESGLFVSPGVTLAEASRHSRTPLLTRCDDKRCGGCVVEHQNEVGLSPAGPLERAALADNHSGRSYAAPRERLACHAEVSASGAEVQLRAVWTLEDVLGAGPPLT